MIEVGELRDALRIDGTAEDSYLVELEKAAVAYCEQQTGRYFGTATTRTERLRGTGHDKLWLEEKATTLPTTVTEIVNPGDTGVTITAADDDGYEDWGDTVSVLVRKAGNVWNVGNIYVVTYALGYTEGNEPSDIRKAVRDLVVYWYEKRVPVGDVGQVFTFEAPHHVGNLIRNWWRLRV